MGFRLNPNEHKNLVMGKCFFPLTRRPGVLLPSLPGMREKGNAMVASYRLLINKMTLTRV